MSIDNQKRTLHTVHSLTTQSPMMDDHAYLGKLLYQCHELATKGLAFATKLKQGYRFALPVMIEMGGHIPLKVKSVFDNGVEQFDYVYGEAIGVVNVSQVRDGKITKYDKTPLCEQLDIVFDWKPWSPTPVEHYVAKEGNTLTGGVAER